MEEALTNSYIALDLETTGIGAKREKITEIGMVKVIDGEACATYHTLVNPYRTIPERIVELTGITDAMVADAPGIEEILDDVIAFTENLPLLGHQIIFDYGFLVQAAVNQKKTFEKRGVDTLRLCRLLMPGTEKKNLNAACEYFKIKRDVAHRALSDAYAAHDLYQVIKELHGEERSDLFQDKPLQYKAKKERTASKRQKEHLRELVKYHRIDVTFDMDHMSGNEISRLTDQLILRYGRIPKQTKEKANGEGAN